MAFPLDPVGGRILKSIEIMSCDTTRSLAAWKDDGGAEKMTQLRQRTSALFWQPVRSCLIDQTMNKKLQNRHRRQVLRAQAVDFLTAGCESAGAGKAAQESSCTMTRRNTDSLGQISAPIKAEATL
jgi:hypothetical protein